MQTRTYAAQRGALISMYRRAVEAVSARVAMPTELPLPLHGRALVIAIGKAAAAMMQVAVERIAAPVSGLVVTRYEHLADNLSLPASIEVIEAGHPVPDQSSVRAADRALELARSLRPQDHLLVLLSGGGSALCAAPVAGITLADKQATTRALLASGATIAEMNCVRKHLSRIKGGKLALAASGAAVTTLIISDVPGDDPSFVSSGPTVADETTPAQARAVLAKYGIDVPTAVKSALADPANESPPRDSSAFAGAKTIIVARASDALDAAAGCARSFGYEVTDLGDRLEGEARQLGAEHAALARQLAIGGPPRAIVSGGETTVTIANRHGRGGRNLEYLLGLAIALDGAPGICALACDTDGIDGTEDAAGAIVLPDTLQRARSLGLDPLAYLRNNDSYSFFQKLEDLVITGATLTNVNDFRVILTQVER
jgi:glycerate 2-kinase